MLPTPTANAAKRLFIRLLKASRPKRVSRLRENIAVLDKEDQSFSTVTNHLISNGTADPKRIIHWVSGRIHAAIWEAKDKSSDYGIDYTSTNFILEDAMMLTAIDRLGYGNDNDTAWLTQAGHKLLLKEAPELRPHLLASIDTVDRYYRALATVIHIVHPHIEYHRFREEVPDFIAWAKDHEEPILILEAATRAQSLNRETIEAFMPMIRSTPSVVQDGLL